MLQGNPPIERNTFILFRELAKTIRIFQEGPIFCEDVTFSQFAILDYVADQGRLEMATLHGLLAVEKSTTTRLVEPLIKKGLLIKEKAAHDSRAIDLVLTAQGRVIHQKVWDCFSDGIQRLIALIPAEEQETVLKSVKLFVRALFLCCGKEGCCN